MADANGTLSPPPFREALTYESSRLLVDTWQRWLDLFWQQAQTTAGNAPGPGPWQSQDATLTAFAALTGTPNTLPYFTGPDAFALTPLSPYSRSLLDDTDAAAWRSTLGLGSGSTITASGTATWAALWSSATTLTATDCIKVGAGYKLGLNSYPPPVNVGLRGYRTALDSLYVGFGDVLARWPLDCPGQAHVLQLGVYYGPDNAATDGVDFKTYRAKIDLLGVGYRADSGYALRAGSSYLDTLTVPGTVTFSGRLNVGSVMAGNIGHGYDPSRWPLDINGKGHINHLGVAGAPDDRWSFTNWGTSYFSGTTQFSSGVAIAGAPDGYWFHNYGHSYQNGTAEFNSTFTVNGDAHMRGGHMGVGNWADPNYTFRCYWNSYFDGPTTLIGTVGFGGGPNPSYHLTNHGASYLYGAVGVATVPSPLHGFVCGATARFNNFVGIMYDADSRFVVRMGGNIYCDGVPYNGGGGPWVAFSDRRLKHNIQTIPAPLETMCALHGVMYEYNDTDMGRPAGVRLGVIAQEVEEVIPEWVGELDGYKTTQLSAFEALTIESFKAVMARLEALEQAGWQ